MFNVLKMLSSPSSSPSSSSEASLTTFCHQKQNKIKNSITILIINRIDHIFRIWYNYLTHLENSKHITTYNLGPKLMSNRILTRNIYFTNNDKDNCYRRRAKSRWKRERESVRVYVLPILKQRYTVESKRTGSTKLCKVQINFNGIYLNSHYTELHGMYREKEWNQIQLRHISIFTL